MGGGQRKRRIVRGARTKTAHNPALSACAEAAVAAGGGNGESAAAAASSLSFERETDTVRLAVAHELTQDTRPDPSSKRRAAPPPSLAPPTLTRDKKGEEGVSVHHMPKKGAAWIRRDNPRAVLLDDADLEALRLDIQRKMQLNDDGDNSAAATVASVETAAAAAAEVSEALPVDTASGLCLPEDPRTGMISLSRANLPAELNVTEYLPLTQMSIASYLDAHMQIVNEFLALLPLLDVPVYTSRLVCLLFMKTAQFPTQSAFSMFRLYFGVLHICATLDIVRRRVPAALTWLKRRVVDNMLTHDDIERVAELCHYPALPETHEGKEEEGAKEKGAVDGLHDLLTAGSLTPSDVDACVTQVERMDRVAGGTVPWLPAGTACAEDVLDDHLMWATATSEGIGNSIDVLCADAASSDAGGAPSVAAVDAVIHQGAVRLLNFYEFAIMRLFSEEVAIGGATIPRKFFGDLATPQAMPDMHTVVHVAVAPAVLLARRNLTAVHNYAMMRTPETRDVVEAMRSEAQQQQQQQQLLTPAAPLQTRLFLDSGSADEQVAHFINFLHYMTVIADDADERARALAAVSSVYANETLKTAAEVVAEVEHIAESYPAEARNLGGILWEAPDPEEAAMKARLQHLDLAAHQKLSAQRADADADATLPSLESSTDTDDGDIAVV